jgi:hypothetical protein
MNTTAVLRCFAAFVKHDVLVHELRHCKTTHVTYVNVCAQAYKKLSMQVHAYANSCTTE